MMCTTTLFSMGDVTGVFVDIILKLIILASILASVTQIKYQLNVQWFFGKKLFEWGASCTLV